MNQQSSKFTHKRYDKKSNVSTQSRATYKVWAGVWFSKRESDTIASHLAESTLVLRGSDHPTGDTYTQMLNDTSNMMTHDDIYDIIS